MSRSNSSRPRPRYHPLADSSLILKIIFDIAIASSVYLVPVTGFRSRHAPPREIAGLA